MAERTPRIEICGGIASGKTTLATALREIGKPAVFENFKDNPFWPLFYQAPDKYAFETELTFLLQHYCHVKLESERQHAFVCDFSLVLDQAYADVNLRGERLHAFQGVYGLVRNELPPSALLVHLRCNAAEELARIRRRARREELRVTVDYLEALNKAIERRVKESDGATHILTIDSEANDFAHDPDTRGRIAQMVLDALPPSTVKA